MQGKALQRFCYRQIDDPKGQDIIALHARGKSSITDCKRLFCTGTSSRRRYVPRQSLQRLRAAGMLPLGVGCRLPTDRPIRHDRYRPRVV
ncbi:hypothetical protein KCP71_24165 [Salmonella enterica subsp. enterica]|nr:hypothetical protein KCP71_24165 [Salmonella enterica subsp. enterica]